MADKNGLDKIIEKILKQARAKADEICADAEKEAESVLAAARAEADETVAAAERTAEKSSANYTEQRKNTDEQNRKVALLKVRSAMIEEVLDEAYHRVVNLDDEANAEFLLKLLSENVQEGEGVICLGSRDLSRIPSDFAARAGQIAAAKGGSLTVSDKPADIEAGLILVYGDIEENCSLDAIFRANSETFSDKAQEVLFS